MFNENDWNEMEEIYEEIDELTSGWLDKNDRTIDEAYSDAMLSYEWN